MCASICEGSKRQQTVLHATGLLERQSKYVCALGLNGTDPTENRIRGCYRGTLVYSRLDSPFRWLYNQRLAEQDRVVIVSGEQFKVQPQVPFVYPYSYALFPYTFTGRRKFLFSRIFLYWMPLLRIRLRTNVNRVSSGEMKATVL